MEAIFHEQQEGSLCAQHCLNSLLQGQFYSAVDLAELATELDTMERVRMGEMGEDSPEYQRFIQQPSANMDDSGFFSVQVISRALSVWGLELVPLNSSNPAAVRAKASAISATAYICNYREHWFTIRRLGSQWFNMNSLLEGPELVSNTYLGEFLAQLQQEGYDIFLVTGELPECDADLVLQAVPAVQAAPPRLLGDVESSGAGKKSRVGDAGKGVTWGGQGQVLDRRGGETGSSSSAARDEAAEIEAAMMMSLAETSGSDGGPAQLDSEQLARVMEMQREGGWGGEEDQEMEMALRLSQQQPEVVVPDVSEEDEMQRAIALSLEGGAGLGIGQSAAGQAAGGAGWGQRLKQQEEEEEKRYKKEQEQAIADEEEQLRKALAMSMDIDDAQAAPVAGQSKPASAPKATTTATKASKEIDPVHAAWPKIKNPEPGTIAASAPAPSPIKPSPSGSQSAGATSGGSKSPSSVAGPSKAPAEPAIPAGPGHKLGGSGGTSATASGRARPGSAAQPPTDDPQEIRRRRMAFLDKLQKSPPADQDKK